MPKLADFKSLTTLGVINITPNSFSDQGRFLNSQTLKSTLTFFKTLPHTVLDLGFESTAPMNSAISVQEERARFDYFFKEIKDIDLSGCWISFDTYKPLNYLYFEEQFKTRYQNCGFIFNDVGTVLDNEIVTLLKSKRDQENFFYIHTFSHIPSRDFVLNHMNFIKKEEILLQAVSHFKKVHYFLKEENLIEQILFDPGFGFSKSYEQNWDLLNQFDQLVLKLNEEGISMPWLLGLSKKSFLRNSLINTQDPFKDSEILHHKIIRDLWSKQLGHLLFRAHDPLLVERAIKDKNYA